MLDERLVSMWLHIEWCYTRREECLEAGCPVAAAQYDLAIDAEIASIEQLQGECYTKQPLILIVDDAPEGWDHV